MLSMSSMKAIAKKMSLEKDEPQKLVKVAGGYTILDLSDESDGDVISIFEEGKELDTIPNVDDSEPVDF